MSVAALEPPPSKRKSILEAVRYVIAGVWNTVFGFAVYSALTYVLTKHVPYAYMVAAVLSSAIAITNAYISYKFFVFKTKGNYLREYLRFWVIYGSSSLINLALLPCFVAGSAHVIGDKHIPLFALHSHAVVITRSSAPYVGGACLNVLTIVFSFVGHRKFSFRRDDPAAADVAADEVA